MSTVAEPQIVASTFLNAFLEEWAALVADNERKGLVVDAYGTNGRWSACMLGPHRGNEPPGGLKKYLGEKGFLARVGSRLGVPPEQVRREDYTLDCCYVGGEKLMSHDNWGYASYLRVLIEHENDLSSIHYEMWKLLFWRSPLKIIISYEGKGDENRGSTLLERKIDCLRSMRESVDAHTLEGPNVSYLLLVGARDAANELPHWKFSLNFQKAEPLG